MRLDIEATLRGRQQHDKATADFMKMVQASSSSRSRTRCTSKRAEATNEEGDSDEIGDEDGDGVVSDHEEDDIFDHAKDEMENFDMGQDSITLPARPKPEAKRKAKAKAKRELAHDNGIEIEVDTQGETDRDRDAGWARGLDRQGETLKHRLS